MPNKEKYKKKNEIEVFRQSSVGSSFNNNNNNNTNTNNIL